LNKTKQNNKKYYINIRSLFQCEIGIIKKIHRKHDCNRKQ